MNYHSPIARVGQNTDQAHEIDLAIGSVVEIDEFDPPSGERNYGGVGHVIGQRAGAVRVQMDVGSATWVPIASVMQALDGFVVGKTDARYEFDDHTLLALADRLTKLNDRHEDERREWDTAHHHYKAVLQGRGISDTGPDGKFITPRSALLEVRRKEREVAVETGYHAITERHGRQDMLRAMLRYALIKMPTNTPAGAAAKLEALIQDETVEDDQPIFVEKMRTMLKELRSMAPAAAVPTPGTNEIDRIQLPLPENVDGISLQDLRRVADGLDMSASILVHMADMETIEDRRATFYMEEIGGVIRSAWTAIVEHAHARAPQDAREAASRNYMVVEARLKCSGLDGVQITGPGVTDWLAEASEKKSAS